MRSIVPVLLVACTLGQPLPACINDSATRADEQQFASGYGESGRSGQRIPQERFNPGMLLLVIPSLVLLGVGFFWLRQERLVAIKRQQRMFRPPEA